MVRKLGHASEHPGGQKINDIPLVDVKLPLVTMKGLTSLLWFNSLSLLNVMTGTCMPGWVARARCR